jgi:chemotaxis protein CheD
MSEIIVGIADMKISNDSKDILVTYALGSCIAVAIYDPVAKAGGLLHYMLSDSSIDLNKAKVNPFLFADTGIPALFKSCYRLGAEKKRIIVKTAGGASILDDADYFRIGEKNIMALRKIFWKNNVFIEKEDMGKNYNRTVRLDIASGICRVKGQNGRVYQL